MSWELIGICCDNENCKGHLELTEKVLSNGDVIHLWICSMCGDEMSKTIHPTRKMDYLMNCNKCNSIMRYLTNSFSKVWVCPNCRWFYEQR